MTTFPQDLNQTLRLETQLIPVVSTLAFENLTNIFDVSPLIVHHFATQTLFECSSGEPQTIWPTIPLKKGFSARTR